MKKDYKAEYAAKLRDPRWKTKRDHILQRDGGLCRHCWPEGEDYETGHTIDELRWCRDDYWYVEQKNVQVHHKVYHFGREPWDYDDSELITLCSGCHENVHYRMWVDKIRGLEDKHNLPQLKPGLHEAKELCDHYRECIEHPNYPAYLRELKKVRDARARFYGVDPENWID